MERGVWIVEGLVRGQRAGVGFRALVLAWMSMRVYEELG